MDFEFTDRYDALGVPYPDPKTICPGQCEGLGVYPVSITDPTLTDGEQVAWHAAEVENPNPPGDTYHFIGCPDCGRTGNRPAANDGGDDVG